MEFFFLPKHVKVVTMQVFLKLPQLVINCCFMTSIVVTGEQVSLSSCCELQPSSCLSQQKSCMHHGTREGVSTLERLQKHLPRVPQTTELFSSSSVFFFLAVFETCSVFCQPSPLPPHTPILPQRIPSLPLILACPYHHLPHFQLGGHPDTPGTSCEPPRRTGGNKPGE